MAENLPNLMQETDSQVQEHRGSQTRWTHTDPHWDMKVKWKWESLSRVQLSVTPLTIQSMEFSRPFPSPGVLPNPGIEPGSPALQADSLPAELQGKPKNTGVGSLSLLQWIFPTQESNRGLLHCRQILYQLSYPRSPEYVYAHLIGKCQEIWQHQDLEKMWINGVCYTLPLGMLTGLTNLENNLSPSRKIRYSHTLYIKHNNFSCRYKKIL